MITIAKTFEWDMGHRVTNHASKCQHPHGHRYKLIVTIAGPVIEQAGSAQEGMILDFGDFKTLVNDSVIAKLDHSFMYWQKDAIMLSFAKANPKLHIRAVPYVPTAENIVHALAKELTQLFAKKFDGVYIQSLKLYETPNSYAVWQKEAA